MKKHSRPIKNSILITSIAVSISLLSACGGGDSAPLNTATVTDSTPKITLNIPDSMTGGVLAAAAMGANQQNQAQIIGQTESQMVVNAVKSSKTNNQCQFVGDDDEDHFKNSYKMTKFMVSVVASWTCISDKIILISKLVAHDGAIVETENDTTASNYDPEEPTHYSIADDSKTQTTIRIYYNYPRITPPRAGDDPQFYMSWNETGLNTAKKRVEGKLIIDGTKIQSNSRKTDDPTFMRMDFDYTLSLKDVDMFLRFDNGNQWADGIRINVSKDLTADPLKQVYLARGLIKMKKQFSPVSGITEIPNVQLYTVSDLYGKGASIAEFQDLSLPLELNAATNNHLGNYLFTKTDTYYFQINQGWDWVDKKITSSEYRGGRTTPATGGISATDPSLEDIKTVLSLDPNYFTGSLCAVIGDNCNELLNAIFRDGFFSHEQNQGNNPVDWRATALASAQFLNSVYPHGADWFGAFDFNFTPSLN